MKNISNFRLKIQGIVLNLRRGRKLFRDTQAYPR
jgi:hypothetical protein